MTNRNGSEGSKNQGSPKAQHDQEFSSELATGDNNKGNKYRSKIGSKSQSKSKQSKE
ncbi:imidazoleglycerol-phosphate dehydratase [Fictibacillus sp. b24]|uniref:imidazoleglycerol-phosphate dehydratase n=1 Tax=Fictibacillus sp. b24 TaxID=3055863 RepID=UPI0025A25232|nr:imidazoleglycerol-phosphate dehydratase [Fictibacillus sp. b24]MDM5317179.1 imidazoleglycerol-phosphate dehydratase [Fictibacillus sp. b24]